MIGERPLEVKVPKGKLGRQDPPEHWDCIVLRQNPLLVTIRRAIVLEASG